MRLEACGKGMEDSAKHCSWIAVREIIDEEEGGKHVGSGGSYGLKHGWIRAVGSFYLCLQ